MNLLQTIRAEWPVIRQAPVTIALSVLLLTCAVSGVIYWGFHENLSRKNDLIQTLQEQLDASKKDSKAPSLQAPTPTGAATSEGDGNVVNTGKIGTIQAPPPKK